MDLKTLAILLFILTYGLLLTFPKYRAHIAVIAAFLFVMLDIVPVEVMFSQIDWNVILMIVGTMGVVGFFIESKMPALLADIIVEKTPNVKWAVVLLSIAAGLISAFIDNVATVLMFAPVALVMCKRLNISPVMPIIAIAISSNLQGAATLVGDTTSILLGSYLGMNFSDFFFFKGKFSLFWIVQAGAIASILILLWFFRKEKNRVEPMPRTKVSDYVPTVLLALIVVLLIIASFINNKPKLINGIICISLFGVGLIYKLFRTGDFKVFAKSLSEIDYETVILLASLFVIIAGLKLVGVIQDISNFFIKVSGQNVLLAFLLIVWGSVLISAFVDNIPYVMAMLHVVDQITVSLNLTGNAQYVLFFGLIIGATLGGNLSPIGASANITSIGILRRDGYEVKTWDFMKLGIPFTLTAVAVGSILVYLIWG